MKTTELPTVREETMGTTSRSANRASVLQLFLIRPSKYDDDGYVVRYWRGVLPSNTVACLYGLSEDVRQQGFLDGVDLRVQVLDETVSKIPLDELIRLDRKPGVRVVVCLVGVQTNQFCRATDIALALRREGVSVILGGFHVSGMVAMFPTLSPEIERLVASGVSVVAGEVEGRWDRLLRDAWEGTLQPVYRFIDDPPGLFDAPPPVVSKRSLRKFVSSNFGTIDCSRGCPYACSFCTIINVQGRKIRYRSAECIAETLRRNYQQSGIYFYFFTDDNFSRNPNWEAILDALIRLREEEGFPIEFMIQVDVLSYRIPGFIGKAARAGCSNVFIGMESINPLNLKDVAKTQNHVREYRDLIEAWHTARISTHVAYIIGFPQDTEESVREDVERLIKDFQPHRASFFMMMPLPGSRDHQQMVQAGSPLSTDYNSYDSFHECMPHPRMKGGAWKRTYIDAWRTFYSFDNMKAILTRADPKNYWDIFRNFYWYKSSALNEGMPPMIAGLFRLKDRKTRREGFPIEARLAHLRRRLPEVYRFFCDTLRLTLEMEELWLQTRKRSETERRVHEELAWMRAELRRSLRISELQMAYARAKARMPSIEIPSRLSLLRAKLSVRRVSRLRETRGDLSGYWMRLGRRIDQGRLRTLLRMDQMALNVLREIRLAAGFFVALATGGSHETS